MTLILVVHKTLKLVTQGEFLVHVLAEYSDTKLTGKASFEVPATCVSLGTITPFKEH